MYFENEFSWNIFSKKNKRPDRNHTRCIYLNSSQSVEILFFKVNIFVQVYKFNIQKHF